jgi:signal transduction histidine kinase
MAVLLLLYLYQSDAADAFWTLRLTFFTALFAASLASIQLAPDAMLARGWFQVGLFLADIIGAAITLSWTRTGSDLFLIYVLIIFGTVLIRSSRQALFVAVVTVALYMIGGWASASAVPERSEFWLRALFLIVSTTLLGILARDSAQAQEDAKRRYDERIIQVERLATLGRVAAEVAHRIKGPLTTIAVNAEVLAQRHSGDKGTLKELSQIGEEVERCKEILKILLDLGRIEEMDTETLDLSVAVDHAARRIGPLVKEKGARLILTGQEAPLQVRGDETLIQEALFALMQNAVEASRRGGRIRVEASTVNGSHCVSVVDNGSGVARQNLEKIFEPFFTTKKEGSGLGLSAALRIAQKHGGTIVVASEGVGHGSSFTLTLPASG